AVLCALEELVAAVVESGRALCEALLEVNPRLRANLRLADLRDEVDELAGWHGDLLQREVVNDAPERYRVEHVAGWSPAAPGAAAASAGAGARTLASGTTAGADGAGAAARATTPAGPDSDAAANAGPAVAPPRALTGASRVRFSEKWRLEADGVELCATLPGDRLLCRLDGRLLCLDADSGRTHWRLGAAASSGAALTEDGGLLVATGGGHLAAYGTADGSKLWEIPGQGADEPRGAGRPLRVALGGRALLVLGTGDQRVLCLDAATGARVWEFAARRGGGFHFAALERLLFVATANGSVCALDLSDGRLVWRFKARARLEHAPVVWHDQVMVCSGRSPVDDGRVFALDAFSGELRWQRRVGTAVECAPLLHGGRLFVSAEHAGGARLVAIRAADGVVLWRRELESAGVAPVGTAVACAGLVVVKSDAGGVHALDPATGERRWMVSLAGGVVPDVLRNAPLRSWGEALFAGYDAAYLLDPADGRVLLRIDDQGGIPDDLAVDAAGRVFVCEEGDHLAAHKLTTVLRVVR
ncbi:MAG TPA: PQQ-binding-like beta-propeller repeat protein, partial [Myxococcota bacterium]|nr:PQQ-binding-like beta-propeller repeat protein [Myxococcota bacterium]